MEEVQWLSHMALQRRRLFKIRYYRTREYIQEGWIQLLQAYTLQEGFVALDRPVVMQHIRAVLNEMKKKRYKEVHDKSFVSY